MAEPADLRGVIDPRIGIAEFIERDRPEFVRRADERLAHRAANGGPGLHRDLARLVVWGGALMLVLRIASRLGARSR